MLEGHLSRDRPNWARGAKCNRESDAIPTARRGESCTLRPLHEASMDDLNYRRLMKYQKRRCEESGATQYMDPQGIYRSIIEDHERFETCFDCGYLVGWCPAPDTCEQPVWVAYSNGIGAPWNGLSEREQHVHVQRTHPECPRPRGRTRRG